MAGVCTICQNPQLKEIDTALAWGAPKRRIASDFGLSERSVGRHFRNCFQPKLRKAQEDTATAVVKDQRKFQEEVYYSSIQKVRMMMDQVLDDLKQTPAIAERIPLYREFRGLIQEEAKLTGMYKRDGEAEYNAKKALEVIRAYRKAHPDIPLHEVVEAFATSRGIDLSEEDLGTIG